MDVEITAAIIAVFGGLIGAIVGAITAVISAYISHLSLKQKQDREIDAAEKRIDDDRLDIDL